jgi:hypothetical protein
MRAFDMRAVDADQDLVGPPLCAPPRQTVFFRCSNAVTFGVLTLGGPHSCDPCTGLVFRFTGHTLTALFESTVGGQILGSIEIFLGISVDLARRSVGDKP